MARAARRDQNRREPKVVRDAAVAPPRAVRPGSPRSGRYVVSSRSKQLASRSSRRADRRRRLVEAATDLAIELYGPALKELEKH